jgi:hypothetical protein
MTRRLPITATLTALVLCAAALRADLAVSPARLPGSSLDTSLRNETDRAVRQAARWLADRQRTDGAWGESNRVRHTSLALSALAAARQPEHSDAIARAALWLGATETNRLTCLGDHAWRLIALSLAVSETPERGRLFNRLAGQRAQETSDASEDDLRLWREALVQSRLSPPPSRFMTPTPAACSPGRPPPGRRRSPATARPGGSPASSTAPRTASSCTGTRRSTGARTWRNASSTRRRATRSAAGSGPRTPRTGNSTKRLMGCSACSNCRISI